MISLPSKPWKRILLKDLGRGRYRITAVSPFKDEAGFREFVEEELAECLGGGDLLEEPSWKDRTIILLTGDVDGFRRRCAFRAIRVELQQDVLE
jgi:hypothetical protein